MGMKKRDVFAEESFKFGEILRAWGGEKRDIFSRRIPLFWGEFWGMEGEIEVSHAEEIPPERARTVAMLEGEKGEKWEQKKDPQRIATGPFRVPLFVRHHARLISDVIIVSHDNSLYMHYSTPGLVRQE